MTPALVIFGAALLVIVALLYGPIRRIARRKSLRTQPLPSGWITVIEEAMPFYSRIPSPLRKRLDTLIQQFVTEKEFVGCQGLVVTMQMKVAIAAQACLLVLNRPTEVYDELYSILLYPTAFIVPEEEHDEAGVVTLHENVLSGQAWDTHRIVLSWEDVQRTTQDANEGYNVVFHEFAHYLDAEDGDANGAPLLGGAQHYDRWSRVMTEEYERLRSAAEHGEPTLIDPYGAQDPAEFFAVATETFFEQPSALRLQHPALYGELSHYYRLDPASWLPAAGLTHEAQ